MAGGIKLKRRNKNADRPNTVYRPFRWTTNNINLEDEMITLELTENDAICILAVMEKHLSEIWKIQKENPCHSTLRIIIRETFIVRSLREKLGLSDYATEIDKLEAKESKNDSKTVGIESYAEAREGNDARCEQCWHNTVIGSNLRTSMGRPAEDISDQEESSQPVG